MRRCFASGDCCLCGNGRCLICGDPCKSCGRAVKLQHAPRARAAYAEVRAAQRAYDRSCAVLALCVVGLLIAFAVLPVLAIRLEWLP